MTDAVAALPSWRPLPAPPGAAEPGNTRAWRCLIHEGCSTAVICPPPYPFGMQVAPRRCLAGVLGLWRRPW